MNKKNSSVSTQFFVALLQILVVSNNKHINRVRQ